jgi:hypothetical protein
MTPATKHKPYGPERHMPSGHSFCGRAAFRPELNSSQSIKVITRAITTLPLLMFAVSFAGDHTKRGGSSFIRLKKRSRNVAATMQDAENEDLTTVKRVLVENKIRIDDQNTDIVAELAPWRSDAREIAQILNDAPDFNFVSAAQCVGSRHRTGSP